MALLFANGIRRGAVATLDNVQVLGDDEGALGFVGYDVLLISPSGRASESAYILGLANGVGLLYNSLNLRATGAATARDFSAAPSVDGWQATLYPRDRDTAGALTVTSIECRLDSVSATVPVIRLEGGGARTAPGRCFHGVPERRRSGAPDRRIPARHRAVQNGKGGGFHRNGSSGRLRGNRGPLAGRCVRRRSRRRLPAHGVRPAPLDSLSGSHGCTPGLALPHLRDVLFIKD